MAELTDIFRKIFVIAAFGYLVFYTIRHSVWKLSEKSHFYHIELPRQKWKFKWTDVLVIFVAKIENSNEIILIIFKHCDLGELTMC